MDKRCQAITVQTVFAVAFLMHLGVATAADGVKVSTFSIVAVDPQTGECGAAVASKYPAVGKVVPYVQADVGAFCTQHYHVPAWGPIALEQLAMGKPVEVIIAELLGKDRHPGQRQLSIIDMQGNTAVHHPTDAAKGSQYWGAMTGRFYACQGNTLAGSEVITQMAKAYERAEGSFTDRLVAALLAGDRAGGDHRGRLAAGVRVAKKGEAGVWFQLDVDESDDAVNELVENYLKSKHAARGNWLPKPVKR